jgi:hypothetical protein
MQARVQEQLAGELVSLGLADPELEARVLLLQRWVFGLTAALPLAGLAVGLVEAAQALHVGNPGFVQSFVSSLAAGALFVFVGWAIRPAYRKARTFLGWPRSR